jgi:hypothetical protein
VAGSYERSDEPSGYGTTDLISCLTIQNGKLGCKMCHEVGSLGIHKMQALKSTMDGKNALFEVWATVTKSKGSRDETKQLITEHCCTSVMYHNTSNIKTVSRKINCALQ